MQKKETKISWDIEYKSPARKLISVFKKGRDHWKLRYKENSKNTEALRKKVYDLTSSRDNWKSKALLLEKELEELRSNEIKETSKTHEVEVVKKTTQRVRTKINNSGSS